MIEEARMSRAVSPVPTVSDDQRDAVAAAAPAALRRAPVAGGERGAVAAGAPAVTRRARGVGVPVARAGLAQEASVVLGAPPQEALVEVDAVAQQLGVSSLR